MFFSAHSSGGCHFPADRGAAASKIDAHLRSRTCREAKPQESQQSSFHDLLSVQCLALATVFVVVVIQLRVFRPALIILSAAPLSLVAVFAMLLITGTGLNVS